MYTEALAAIQGQDDPVTYMNEFTYTWKPYFISYRTLLAMFPVEQVAGVAQAIQSANPLAHSLLLVPGDQQGTAGGVDISLEQSRGMIELLRQAKAFSTDDADKILNLSRTANPPRYASFGFNKFDSSDLTKLPDNARFEGLSHDVTNLFGTLETILRFIDRVPDATVTFKGLTGSSDLSSKKTAIQSSMATWRSKLDNNEDVSAMPVTASDIWQLV